MQTSDLEDCLEAILKIARELGHNATASSIAEELQCDETFAKECITELLENKEIIHNQDDTIGLTATGRARGEKIIRNHKVLECFLRETLGMEAGRASEEACTLEHNISDEAIDRLSDYMGQSRPRGYGRGRMRRRESESFKNLLDFEEADRIRVLRIRGPGWNRRLIDLGIVPGEVLTIRRKLRNDSIVVQVKGCDVALSPEVARTIFVELCQ